MRVNLQMKPNSSFGKENIKDVVVEIISRLTKGGIGKINENNALVLF